jgi:hypothetical protein
MDVVGVVDTFLIIAIPQQVFIARHDNGCIAQRRSGSNAAGSKSMIDGRAEHQPAFFPHLTLLKPPQV